MRYPVTITLLGTRPNNISFDSASPDPTIKGIKVTGTLDIHGKRYFQTWTRLARNVDAGSQALVLQNEVNWEPGTCVVSKNGFPYKQRVDFIVSCVICIAVWRLTVANSFISFIPGQKIVLVTSSMYDSRAYHQNEELTVDYIHPDPPAGVGAVVFVKEQVQHEHIANDNYQVEVGLLSRMIKIQGSSTDSEPSDPDPLTCRTTESSGSFYYNLPKPCLDAEKTGYGGT